MADIVCVEGGQWQDDETSQEIVELVFVAEVGPALAADGVDGVLVETACAFGDAIGKGTAE